MRAGRATPASVTFGDSLWAIPRGPVFGTRTLGTADRLRWQRVDRQGPAIYTTSGRAAILLGLRALGVGPGDRVLVPTYHCPTMVEPAVVLGATPLFYPIGRRGEPDARFLEQCDTQGVKALLAAHLFGLPQDFSRLRAFCDTRGIKLIEDCAHCFFGETPDGRAVGSTGDFAIASLPKFFPAIEGGCLTVPRRAFDMPRLGKPSLTQELRAAWDTIELAANAGTLGAFSGVAAGAVRLKERLRRRSGPPAAGPSVQAEPDLRAACDTIRWPRAGLRAVATVRWIARHADVQRIAAARRANYAEFAAQFAGEADMRPLSAQLAEGAVPYVFPLEVDDPLRLYQAVRRLGVPLFRWDLVWPGTPQLQGDCAPQWSTRVFQLCCHQDMSVADVRRVADVIKRARSGRA